jgi:hypothetical protein
VDHSLVVPRYLPVPIDTLSLSVDIGPPTVGVNGLVRFHWDAPNALHCTLEDGTILPTSGTRFFVLPKTRIFTLTAHGEKGQTHHEQFTVQVDPAIVATEPPIQVTGDQGLPGEVDPLHYLAPSPGGRGQDASLSKTVPGLDLTSQPSRVFSITLTAGKGGDGQTDDWTGTQFGSDGGPGGDAILNLILDSSIQPPAQFIINLVPGPGGDPGFGNAWTGPGYVATQPGPSGSTSMTITEVNGDDGNND